ncbi:MAG: HAMP domain-containing histidine kinase [Deltaproteobacteria bacterium]|nr:HAMP domain-containing histidine kinase [Deltaproteobacteria bacterium]
MEEVRNKRRLLIFLAVATVLIAQVTWWTIFFLRNVKKVESLRTENYRLFLQLSAEPNYSLDQIRSDAFHERAMFVSESSFFVVLTGFGLVLLYLGLRKEARSREIQKNFIQIISHESKTPLTALKLRLESLMEKGSEYAHYQKDLQLALDEVRRLSLLFEKVMNLNRLERHALHFEVVNLSELIRLVVLRMEPLLKAKAVNLSLNLEEPLTVRGDTEGLQNCFQALFENAVFYNTADSKQLAVSIKSVPGKVQIDVWDNGPGIAISDRGHLFERFYRGQTGRGVSGTGLGLYIVKQVIAAHQGDIRLADAAEGTLFRIELPAV